MGYVNGYLDMTSLYTLGTRYDDPTLGRWTQQDPVGGSLADLNAANRYTYAGDDPINVVDPSGKFYVNISYHYVNTWFGPIVTGIDSITLELTATDLSYGSAIAGAIVGFITAHFGLPGPLAPIVAGIVANAVSRAFASCPNLFLLYANFDTGTYYTQCY